MTSTKKLTVAIKSMWGKNVSWCHHLGAILLVIKNECEPSPALDDLKAQVKKMRLLCRKICVNYDNLRAVAGRLEVEQGVEQPDFWCGEINESDNPVRCRKASHATVEG